ncbi:hypothetical protein ACJMK2_011520, partial [Sinanodonta woodiana]
LGNVQSELFEVKTKYDEAVSAKSDEMDMVMSDLERANERASSAEREVEKLKQQLVTITNNLTQSQQTQKGPDMEHAIDILQRSSLEVELAAKEKEISQLVEDVRRLQASLAKLKETTEVQVAKLEEELAYKNKALTILEEKLQRQEDYEEIKRELNVLKSIEFPSSSTGEEREGVKAKSLEILLLEKNKTLQSENTQLKVSSGDLSGNTSPTLSSNAEAFATMLGKEIAETYQLPGKDGSRESSPVNSPNESIDAPSPKDECPASHQDSNAFFQGHLKPPKTPSTPTTPLNSIDMHRFPPPSPVQQFYSPFGNNHLMNFMNMGAVKPDMNGTQGLDTGMVAKTVRELLSIHNIGQRLFAKHILGLSQGTVSELLSKPKSWDKLTEKGRESYRKMHAWAVDERNILALKAISPKKGSQPLLPTIQREDSATEERISQILNEAQHAMQMKKVMEQVWKEQHVANAMATSIYHEMARYNSFQNSHPISTTNPTPSVNTISNGVSEHRGRKHSENERSYKREPSYEGDVSSKEMVERIYRQELMKLAQAAENAGNIAAVTLYRQELSRLAHNSQVRHHDEREPGELRRARDEPDGISVKTEPPDSTSDDLVSNGPIDLSKHSNSKPTTPTSSGSEKSLNSNSAHPTASAFFLVRPNANGHDKFDNHPPPTQPNVGPFSPTECVSPLQRMQNIANSLMTRSHVGPPITKSMKAVLPPITQEEFDKYSNMNTDDLVKKVKETLSQYSISQRLFGESVLGLSQGSVSDLLARPKPWHMLTQKGREPFIRMQLFLEDAEAIPKLVASQYHIPPDKLMRSQSVNKEPKLPSDKLCKNPPAPIVFPSLPVPPPINSHHLLSHHQHHHHNWATFSYPSSMLEVVAMTSEIDTLELTSRIKDILQFNNLGQKLFGEAVLGLSQGSVSELLSKPKPWHMLSIKGREPFIKMHLWLSDPHNVERLKHYQNEMKANRRRRSSLEDRYDSPVSLPKRPRVFFTEEQKDILRTAYSHDPYPNQNTIEGLANELNVGVKTVINWFHNHRMRAKQQQHNSNGPINNLNDSFGSSKSDQLDENSNQSDLSSLSGDNGNFTSGFRNHDSSQWMFPQFELMATIGNQSNSGESDEEEKEERDEEEEEEEAKSPSSTKENPLEITKDKEKSKKSTNSSDESSDTQPLEEKVSNESDNMAINQSQSAPPSSGSNKRKRSNPQYVSAGRNLDRTMPGHDDANSIKITSSHEEDIDTEKENEASGLHDAPLHIKDRVCKINKLQKAIEMNDEIWDEDFDRSASIEKIQKNITEDQTEEWEF